MSEKNRKRTGKNGPGKRLAKSWSRKNIIKTAHACPGKQPRWEISAYRTRGQPESSHRICPRVECYCWRIPGKHAMKKTLALLSATAIAALALESTLCLAKTQTSPIAVGPTPPNTRVIISGIVSESAPRVSAGLRGTSSDPLPPPGFWDPAKAWIREHSPLIRGLAIAQVLVLVSVSGTVFWVTHRRRD